MKITQAFWGNLEKRFRTTNVLQNLLASTGKAGVFPLQSRHLPQLESHYIKQIEYVNTFIRFFERKSKTLPKNRTKPVKSPESLNNSVHYTHIND